MAVIIKLLFGLQIFFLVVLFGLFHGLVFLPVVLSIIGPDPYLSASGAQDASPFQLEDGESLRPLRNGSFIEAQVPTKRNVSYKWINYWCLQYLIYGAYNFFCM